MYWTSARWRPNHHGRAIRYYYIHYYYIYSAALSVFKLCTAEIRSANIYVYYLICVYRMYSYIPTPFAWHLLHWSSLCWWFRQEEHSFLRRGSGDIINDIVSCAVYVCVCQFRAPICRQHWSTCEFPARDTCPRFAISESGGVDALVGQILWWENMCDCSKSGR